MDPRDQARARERRGYLVAGGSILAALGALGLWLLAHQTELLVLAATPGRDPSIVVVKRGILLAGLTALLVASVLVRVLERSDDGRNSP